MTSTSILSRCTDHHGRPRAFVDRIVRAAFERGRDESFDPGLVLFSRRDLGDGELRLLERDSCVLAVGLVDDQLLAIDVTAELEDALG